MGRTGRRGGTEAFRRSVSGFPEAGCGAAILNEAGEILLIRRLRPPEPGHWGLPGGKIDFGEPAETAVKREIAEELGIEIILTHLALLTETIWSQRSMADGAGSPSTPCRISSPRRPCSIWHRGKAVPKKAVDNSLRVPLR